MKHIRWLVPLALLLASCSPFSRQALQQVDVSTPFGNVQNAPQQFAGKNVLWGGIIIDTIVKSDATFLNVMQKSLDSKNRPVEEAVSSGRFLVRHPGFLDPQVYKPGRELTVIGTVTGGDLQPTGELRYSGPVIESKQLHVWEERAKYRRPPSWDYPVVPFPYSSYPYLYDRLPYWP